MLETPSRRRVLLWGTAAAAATLLAEPAFALPRAAKRTVRLLNTHTHEALDLTYWRDGEYRLEALVAANRLLRDHRTGQRRMMDHHLLDQLHTLAQRLGAPAQFHVISAYRSPATNALLREQGAGVAKRSLHMFGKAVDIRIPGYSTRELRRHALAMKAGGVGYYPRSDFVHLDTGPVRSW